MKTKEDRFWCKEGSGFVDEDHRCEQWCSPSRIPAAAIKAIEDEYYMNIRWQDL